MKHLLRVGTDCRALVLRACLDNAKLVKAKAPTSGWDFQREISSEKAGQGVQRGLVPLLNYIAIIYTIFMYVYSLRPPQLFRNAVLNYWVSPLKYNLLCIVREMHGYYMLVCGFKYQGLLNCTTLWVNLCIIFIICKLY